MVANYLNADEAPSQARAEAPFLGQVSMVVGGQVVTFDQAEALTTGVRKEDEHAPDLASVFIANLATGEGLYVTMPAQQAREIAASLIRCADQIESPKQENSNA